MNPKTDCKPIKFRKYHDRLDTHWTSKSRVITPDWSIDLNRIVNGKGSFTTIAGQHISLPSAIACPRTDHESREEGVDPAHDQSLRDHHHHVSLEHAHHSLHCGWIRHRVRRRLAAVVGVLEELSAAEAGDQVVFTGLKGLMVQDGACMVAEVNTTEKRMAFARLGQGRGGLGGRVHQDCRIVAEDTGQDLVGR